MNYSEYIHIIVLHWASVFLRYNFDILTFVIPPLPLHPDWCSDCTYWVCKPLSLPSSFMKCSLPQIHQSGWRGRGGLSCQRIFQIIQVAFGRRYFSHRRFTFKAFKLYFSSSYILSSMCMCIWALAGGGDLGWPRALQPCAFHSFLPHCSLPAAVSCTGL